MSAEAPREIPLGLVEAFDEGTYLIKTWVPGKDQGDHRLVYVDRLLPKTAQGIDPSETFGQILEGIKNQPFIAYVFPKSVDEEAVREALLRDTDGADLRLSYSREIAQRVLAMTPGRQAENQVTEQQKLRASEIVAEYSKLFK